MDRNRTIDQIVGGGREGDDRSERSGRFPSDVRREGERRRGCIDHAHLKGRRSRVAGRGGGRAGDGGRGGGGGGSGRGGGWKRHGSGRGIPKPRGEPGGGPRRGPGPRPG